MQGSVKSVLDDGTVRGGSLFCFMLIYFGDYYSVLDYTCSLVTPPPSSGMFSRYGRSLGKLCTDVLGLLLVRRP
jgi:hypothetical protein